MQIRKTTKTEKILVVTLLLGVLLGSIVGYTIAQSSNTFYITSGVYPLATFTVYKEGSDYKAKNIYGYISVSSSNCSYVLDYCIDNMNGGIIQVLNGEYTIDNGDKRNEVDDITMGLKIEKDNITIRGEGKNTIFIPESQYQRLFTFWANSYCSIENICVDGKDIYNEHYPDSSDCMIAFDYGATYGSVRNVLSINGNNSDGMGCYQCYYIDFIGNTIIGSEHGIGITESIGCKAENNRIQNVNGDGIVISGNGLTWTRLNEVNHNYIANCSINGIEISGNASFCSVKDNTIEYCDRGIVIVTLTNTVEGNYLKGNTHEAIGIGYFGGYVAQGNIIDGNMCMYSLNATDGYGIREYSLANYNLFSDNICLDDNSLGIFVIGANSKVTSCWNNTAWVDYP